MLSGRDGRVVVVDLNAERGEAVAKDIGGRFVRCDVSSESDAAGAISAAGESFGELRGLVNCAGIGHAERTVGKNGPHALASFTRTITINLIGTFNMIRLAAAAMAQTEPQPSGERGVMTLPIARDLAGSAIRVMTIAPGIFWTPLLAGLPEEAQISLGKQVPFPPVSGAPKSMPRSSNTSSQTRCSTAK